MLEKKDIQSKTKSISFDIYKLNQSIYKAYRAFNCDSAILYLNKNIELADGVTLKEGKVYILTIDLTEEMTKGLFLLFRNSYSEKITLPLCILNQ